MKIEVEKEFKDSNGKKREKGEVINVKKDDGLTEDLAENIVDKGSATEKLEKLEIEDTHVKSCTEWWKEVWELLGEGETGSLNLNQKVEATNKIHESVVKMKISNEIQKSKNNQNGETSESKSKSSGPGATDKQINYLDSLGVEYSSTVSKSEASNLIEQEMDKQDPTSKQKNALKKAHKWEDGLSKKEASEKLDKLYG